MRKPIFFYFLSVCFLCSGCQQPAPTQPPQKSIQDQATTLIEQGRNDEAIRIILADAKVHPYSDTDRQILASAYANRAGIQIQDYYGFTISYNSLLSRPQDVSGSEESVDLAALLPSLSAEQKKSLAPVLQDLDLVLKMSNRILQIPLIASTQIADLNLAVDTLEPANSPGAHLYRVILEVILLKYDFTQTAQSVNALIAGTECQKNVTAAAGGLQISFRVIEQILYDLSIAFPSNVDNLLDIQNKVGTLQTSLGDDVQKIEPLLCPGT